MRKPFVHRVGGVLSADIAVPDHEREIDFYSKILTTGNAPLWSDDLTNNFGTPIIGLGVRTPEYKSLPLQWMPHFQVADVAASATCAIEMGGKELMHSKTGGGISQWAVLTDQNGAAFGVIPVVESEPETTQQNERLGCISWLSLAAPDASASRDFYQRVIGWNSNPIEANDSDGQTKKFEMKIDNETAAAEISQFRSKQAGIPSVWLIHLPVDDFAESLRRAVECGGEVIKEFSNEEYAIVRDPVGVFFALQSG